MESSSSDELGASLLPSVENDDGRYDGLGSTRASNVSFRSLVDSITDGSTKATSISGDEADAAADAAAGGASSSPRMSSISLAIILYFGTAGGPFGVEPSLKAAGNLYAIVGFVAMPFIWALPECLMTYELSAMYPCASGGVRWTEEAFGEAFGLLAGYTGWISGIANNAACPVLFLSYVQSQYQVFSDDDILLHYGILSGITILITILCGLGLDAIGKTSTLIFVVTMTPFLVMIVMGVSKVDPNKWLRTPDGEQEVFDDDSLAQQGWFPEANLAGIAFRPFINNLYWNFNGNDQGAHFSYYVPKKTLRNGIWGAFLMSFLGYILPVLVAVGATDMEQEEWNAGSFATAGTEIAEGQWLGHWIVAAAGISQLARYLAGMSADALQLQGMANRGQLPGLFSHRSSRDIPTYALLFNAVLVLPLVMLPFAIIVELGNFAYCISVMLEFTAFAKLRIAKGGGSFLRKFMYTIIFIVPMLFTITVICLASYATYIYGACVTALGVLLIGAKSICSPCCCHKS